VGERVVPHRRRPERDARILSGRRLQSRRQGERNNSDVRERGRQPKRLFPTLNSPVFTRGAAPRRPPPARSSSSSSASRGAPRRSSRPRGMVPTTRISRTTTPTGCCSTPPSQDARPSSPAGGPRFSGDARSRCRRCAPRIRGTRCTPGSRSPAIVATRSSRRAAAGLHRYVPRTRSACRDGRQRRNFRARDHGRQA
jgi:hypothetical protein